MRILLISSAFSGLTQRFFTELEDAGFTVSVELHLGNIANLLEGIAIFKPDLILCPFLTRKLPKEIYQNHTCLIVHPGIKGDRGASSLDWAIQTGVSEWGVSLLEAAEEMDAGPIWANKTFAMRPATKSSLFYREVTQAAIDCLWEVLSYFNAPDFKPEIQDYQRADYLGKTLPLMQQTDRAINWKKHKTAAIIRRINAADGSPGVLDEIYGLPVFLYNAHQETQLTGKPGEIIATANQAICRATIDGAIWIGHLKAQPKAGEKTLKLPATQVLKDLLPKHDPRLTPLKSWLSNSIKTIKALDIDYRLPGRQLPCQELWYEVEGNVAYLYAPFHNGGMSTEQCRLFLSVYQHIATLPIAVIVLMGGEESWCNGIHLNTIEAAANPAEESWLNINAIDDIVYQIITTLDKVTIAALAGSAGAGGAMMALAADKVFAREGIILNPHYKNMGELYGSEYWTYLLPKRVGQAAATALTEQRLPISAKKAWRMGLIDTVLDKNHRIFNAQIKHLAQTLANDSQQSQHCLNLKTKTRCNDESIKPLSTYRQFELTQMYANFYGNDDYHQARKRFVYKINDAKSTPDNIASHRLANTAGKAPASGSLAHFVWQEYYQLGDEATDAQHKDLFILANQLAAAQEQADRLHSLKQIYQHVQDHFSQEEAVMAEVGFRGAKAHGKEHQAMLASLLSLTMTAFNKPTWRLLWPVGANTSPKLTWHLMPA